MNDLVSVIVPIYRVEEYLHQCIDSIICQTHQSLEIILVDDGSPDNCPNICDEYAKKDNRIKVIHKKNGGLSDARNAGLSKSSGDYILFVDSDDFITENCIEILITEAKKKDYDVTISKHASTFIKERGTINSQEIVSNFEIAKAYCDTKFTPCAWNKLYKTSFIKSNKISFYKGILFEDQLWSLQWVTQASHISIIPYATYIYNTRNSSIMSSCKNNPTKSLASWKIILNEYNKQLSHKDYPKQLVYKILIQKIEEALHLFKESFSQFKKNYQEIQTIIPIQTIYGNFRTHFFIKNALYKTFSIIPSPIFEIILYIHLKIKQ